MWGLMKHPGQKTEGKIGGSKWRLIGKKRDMSLKVETSQAHFPETYSLHLLFERSISKRHNHRFRLMTGSYNPSISTLFVLSFKDLTPMTITSRSVDRSSPCGWNYRRRHFPYQDCPLTRRQSSDLARPQQELNPRSLWQKIRKENAM